MLSKKSPVKLFPSIAGMLDGTNHPINPNPITFRSLRSQSLWKLHVNLPPEALACLRGLPTAIGFTKPEERHVLFGESEELLKPITVDAVAIFAAILLLFLGLRIGVRESEMLLVVVVVVGRWKAGPGKSFFDAIFRAAGKINIIAEDLGVITEDVIQLRKSIGAPGMAVLQFGFGSDAANPHLPHNHEPNQVVYTGTHDNDTIRGWWDVLKQEEKSNVLKYLSIAEEDDISWALAKAALSSVARTAIIPMQDILRLGSSARMNIPATQFGNWGWRIPSSRSFDSLETEALQLREMLSMYGRL